MALKKILVCGATGFIGRNILDSLQNHADVELYGVYNHSAPWATLRNRPGLKLVQADLRDPAQAESSVQGMDIVIQAAATTSGAKDIVTRPYIHVTDNAIMNALLFRACFQHGVKHVVYFSCTNMYPSSREPVKEADFNGEIPDKYFGAGWTKVYHEKMCEFFARLGPTRYTVLRHSNIYGPFDKFDLQRSHVFGATITKVMTAPENGQIIVWGDGSELRDLLYVDDLVKFVIKALEMQNSPFELVNVGAGVGISIHELVQQIIHVSGKKLSIAFDRSQPTLNFDLVLNIDRARSLFQWAPETPLVEGIRQTLAWYQKHSPTLINIPKT
jgi:GDP-L-fucose synthase